MPPKKNGHAAHSNPDAIEEVQPIAGAFDFALKLPVWNPKNKIAIKGLLLGMTDLPSAQANQEVWTCYVVELTGPTKVEDQDEEGNDRIRIADAGERVLVTVTAALERYLPAARDNANVFEIYLKPAGSQKTKSGGNVNVFSPMQLGNAVPRRPNQRLPSSSFVSSRALPAKPFADEGAAAEA